MFGADTPTVASIYQVRVKPTFPTLPCPGVQSLFYLRRRFMSWHYVFLAVALFTIAGETQRPFTPTPETVAALLLLLVGFFSHSIPRG